MRFGYYGEVYARREIGIVPIEVCARMLQL